MSATPRGLGARLPQQLPPLARRRDLFVAEPRGAPTLHAQKPRRLERGLGLGFLNIEALIHW